MFSTILVTRAFWGIRIFGISKAKWRILNFERMAFWRSWNFELNKAFWRIWNFETCRAFAGIWNFELCRVFWEFGTLKSTGVIRDKEL